MFTRWPLNVLLFTLACLTTFLVGGPAYSATIMAILLSHEMGHYLQARRYGVPATLPYFIPVPFGPFGTMGAVIKMNNLGADRRALFDIGVSGPLAGLVVAIPATIWGLLHSTIIDRGALEGGSIHLGESLIFHLLSSVLLGTIPEHQDVLLHPIAFAGWAGLFVTALNLLPIGQLDGGHVAYSLWGQAASHTVAKLAMVGFALIALFVNPAWTLMVVLVLLMGTRHPPTRDDTVALGRARKIIGYAALLFFVLSFTPDPLRLG